MTKGNQYKISSYKSVNIVMEVGNNNTLKNNQEDNTCILIYTKFESNSIVGKNMCTYVRILLIYQQFQIKVVFYMYTYCTLYIHWVEIIISCPTCRFTWFHVGLWDMG